MAASAPGAAGFLPQQQPQPSPRAAAAGAAAAAAGSKPGGPAALGTPRASGQQAGHDEFVRSAQLGVYVDRSAPGRPCRQAGQAACAPAPAGLECCSRERLPAWCWPAIVSCVPHALSVLSVA